MAMNFVERLNSDIELWQTNRRAREKAQTLAILAGNAHELDPLDKMTESECMQVGATWQTNALIEESIFGYRLTPNRHFISNWYDANRDDSDSPLRSFSYDACYGIELSSHLKQIGMRVIYKRGLIKDLRWVIWPYPQCGPRGIVTAEGSISEHWLTLARCALVAMKRRRAYHSAKESN
jgi:hypothetical protein